MNEVLAYSVIVLGVASIVTGLAHQRPARTAPVPPPGVPPRVGAPRVVLAVAGLALVTFGVAAVAAPDTAPVAGTSDERPVVAGAREPLPDPTSLPEPHDTWRRLPHDTSAVGAYRRSADGSCARLGVVLQHPVDASRPSIESALRRSAASFEELADDLDGVEPPPRLLNRHHRLVTAVRRTGRILSAADAQLRAGATAGYAVRLEQLGRAVTDLDRQARGLQLPHCRPA
jgi:hypothetical protein